jgi:preprotein translocase subunit SecE
MPFWNRAVELSKTTKFLVENPIGYFSNANAEVRKVLFQLFTGTQ